MKESTKRPQIKRIPIPIFDHHPSNEPYYISYEEFLDFRPYEDDPKYFSWDFMSITNDDKKYLRSLKLNFHINEIYSAYKCVNKQLDMSVYILDYFIDRSKRLAVLKVAVKENNMIVQLNHSLVENNIRFPRLFVGDTIEIDYMKCKLFEKPRKYCFNTEDHCGDGDENIMHNSIRSALMAAAICVNECTCERKPNTDFLQSRMKRGYNFD